METNQAPAPVSVLSLNPALDITYEIGQLLQDQKAHALATRFDPGGNGINVGRALERLQIKAQVFCIVAGEIGLLLKHLLERQLSEVHYEMVKGETRINGTLLERQPGIQYEVSGLGPTVPEAQLAKYLDNFVSRTGQGMAVLTGSTQPGISTKLYAKLVERIRAQGGLPVVDSHDEVLRHAIAARPFLIKPNRFELETLLGYGLPTLEAIATEARKIQQQGVDYICISLGGDGALLTGPENSWHARGPAVTVNSTVGAGDSMVAGLVAGFSREESAPTALRQAIACSASTVSKPGTELFCADELDGLIDRTEIRILDI